MRYKFNLIIILLIILSACGNRVENPFESKIQPASSDNRISIDIADGLITRENPSMPLSDTFTVVLNEQPDADVTIGTIISSDTGEVTVSPDNLVFTPADWSTPQTVTVTGVDDLTADDVQTVIIDLGVTTSTSSDWNNIDPGDVYVYNLDDEASAIPGVLILTGDGLITDETGTSDVFYVVLSCAPTADVIIPVSSLNISEVTVSPSSLTFTPADFDIPQAVTVTGVDDALIDGTQQAIIDLGLMSSADTGYNFDPGDATVYNLDDEIPTVPGVTVIAGPSKLVSETGTSSSFQVVLDSPPLANVTIPVSSDDITEGTVSAPASGNLIFTSSDWNMPQTVTIQGADDSQADGNQPFTAVLGTTVSTDANYSGTIDPADVNFINIDNETAGITVSAGSSMLVSESATSSSFEVVLNSQPTANVTIGISTDDSTEGTITAPFSGTSGNLTFTTANWNTVQTVTVQGENDDAADGNQGFNIVIAAASSTDTNYSGIDPNDIAFTNVDDDIIGITVNGNDGLITDETGLTDNFSIVLNSQPTSNVTLSAISSLDTGEVTVSPSSITFTPANWNISQSITVTGVDDSLIDNEQTVTIDLGLASSLDSDYNSFDPGDLIVYNLDDETPAEIIVFSEMPLVTTENGGEVILKLVLNKQPASDVTLSTITSLDPSEGTIITPSSMIFTPTDWNTPHVIRIRGQQDVDSADTNYTVDLGTSSSSDTNWNAIDPGDVTLLNKNLVTVDTYSWNSVNIPGSYVGISGTGNLITFYWIDPITPYSPYDEGFYPVPIGFPFNYMGKYHSNLVIYTNGFVSFSNELFNDGNFNNSYLFVTYAADEFNDILAPWWDDLSTATGAVYYQIEGTLGNRIFTVEWRNVYAVGGNDTYNFQIKLYESTNQIEFIYGNALLDIDNTSASIGINDNAGLDPANYWLDGFDGSTGNNATQSAANYGRAFTDFPPQNQVISFTP